MKRLAAFLVAYALTVAALAGPIVITGPRTPAAGGGPVPLATDNFNRPVNADLGAAWDPCTGDTETTGFTISITADKAVPVNTAGDSSEVNNTVVWPANQYSKVVFSQTNADGAGAGSGPVARWSAVAKTGYRVVGNASGYELIRFNAGAATVLSSGTGTTFASGNDLQLEIGAAGAWVLKKNGTQFASGTDASPVTSGSAGIGHSSTSTEGGIDSWEGGSL